MIVSVAMIFVYVGIVSTGGALYIVIGYALNNDKSSVNPIVLFGASFIEHV